MKPYRKTNNPVKGRIQIPDEGALLETAGKGLLNLAVELGMEALRQMPEADVAELLAGVSTRKYARARDFDGTEAVCTSKSEVSRKFVKELSALMDEFFQRRIEGDYPIVMMDGMAVGKMTVIAAMGIGSDGRKRMLGLTAGGSENQEIRQGPLLGSAWQRTCGAGRRRK